MLKQLKKLAVPAFLAILILLFSCCAAQKPNPLAYQVYPLTLDGSYTSNGITADVYAKADSPGEGIVRYISPETASGVTVTVSSGGTFLSLDSIVIPLENPEKISDAEIIIAMMTLDPDKLVLVEAYSDKTSEAVFETAFGRVAVTFAQNGLPLKFETEDGSFVLYVKEFPGSDRAQ